MVIVFINMDYYHPLSTIKQFATNDVILVDDLTRAKKIAGVDGLVMKAQITDDKNRIFDLQNSAHEEVLRLHLPDENYERITSNNKLDWNDIDLFFNEEADDAEELLEPLNFIGLKYYKGQDEIILIFNRKNIRLGEIVWSSPFAQMPKQSRTIPKIPKLSQIVNEELENVYLYHGTTKENAISLIQNGVDQKKLISGYVTGFYTYPSIDYLDRHNSVFDKPFEAAVKVKIKPGTKTITIDELEGLNPSGHGSLINMKTNTAVAMGYSIVSRGVERIIVNSNCIESIEPAQLQPVMAKSSIS
jgi:hypothetical protein